MLITKVKKNTALLVINSTREFDDIRAATTIQKRFLAYHISTPRGSFVDHLIPRGNELGDTYKSTYKTDYQVLVYTTKSNSTYTPGKTPVHLQISLIKMTLFQPISLHLQHVHVDHKVSTIKN